jgi:hypothetical protein
VSAEEAHSAGRGRSRGTHELSAPSHPRFMKFLISPGGQDVIKEFNFLTSPILVGGSTDHLPQELADLVAGRYLRGLAERSSGGRHPHQMVAIITMW